MSTEHLIKQVQTVLLLLTTSILLLSCGFFDESEASTLSQKDQASNSIIIEKVTGVGRVEPEKKIIRLYPKTAGIIESVQVKMGEKVKKGQVLFILENEFAAAKNAVMEAKIKEQHVAIEQLHLDLQKVVLSGQTTERTYARIKEIFEKGAGTRQQLEDADAARKSVGYDIKRIETQIKMAQTKLETLRAEQKVKEIELAQFSIKAPSDGMLLEVNTSTGTMVTKNTPLGEFAPESPTSVVTEIDELFANRIRLNQKAYIRTSGGRDTIAYGYVLEYSPSLRRKSIFSEEIGQLEDRRIRKVSIRIEKGAEDLLYGQRVECLIDVKDYDS